MGAVYTSATFSTHSEYKRREVAPAFREDPALGSIITRFLEGPESSYSAPVLDTVDSEFTSPPAYRTGVRRRTHRDGEVMQYEVEYAHLPSRREVKDVEAVSARFPGTSVTSAPGTAKSVYGFVASADRQTAVLHVPAHGYTANTVIGYHLVLSAATSAASTQPVSFSIQGHAVITGSSVNQLSVLLTTPVPAGLAVSFIGGSVRNFGAVMPVRSPLQIYAPARTVYDYFLPGVSTGITTAMDIPLPDAFKVFSSAGGETDTLSATTFPTQTEYEALVLGRREILYQVGLMRWRGNIFERALKFVIAQ